MHPSLKKKENLGTSQSKNTKAKQKTEKNPSQISSTVGKPFVLPEISAVFLFCILTKLRDRERIFTADPLSLKALLTGLKYGDKR